MQKKDCQGCSNFFTFVEKSTLIKAFLNIKKLFPKGEVLLRTLPRGPIGRVAIITFTTYSPKESSLDSPRGLFGLSAIFYLMLFPKGEFLRTSPRGPIVSRRFFLLY